MTIKEPQEDLAALSNNLYENKKQKKANIFNE